MPRTPALHSVLEPDNPVQDIRVARRYLQVLAAVCAEGACSPDPRVTLLALALMARAGSELAEAA